MNGNGMNGSAHGQQTIQVNPIDVAKAGLAFMQRVSFTAAERQTFDAVEAMLNAIANQQVVFAQPPAQQSEAAAPLMDS